MTTRRDRYREAFDSAEDLWSRAASAEEPPPPETVAIRGTKLPCPHCGVSSYFGVGQTPGIDRSRDFKVRGTSACCGKLVWIRCGMTTTVRRARQTLLRKLTPGAAGAPRPSGRTSRT